MIPQITINGDKELELALVGLSKTSREAWAAAANRTAEEVLVEQRKKITQNFMVRVPNFTLPPAILPKAWRATEKRPWTLVALGDRQAVNKSDIGSRRAHLLSKFGASQRKVAKDPAKLPIAIPTPALAPSRAMRIPQKMLPRNLVGSFSAYDGAFQGLTRTARTKNTFRKNKGGTTDVTRKQVGRYFVIGHPGSKGWGLYERRSKGQGGARMLWKFATSVPIPKLLDFEPDARRIIAQRFMPNFDGAMAKAVVGRRVA
jgi:hypothetical protein